MCRTRPLARGDESIPRAVALRGHGAGLCRPRCTYDYEAPTQTQDGRGRSRAYPEGRGEVRGHPSLVRLSALVVL
jgi:hypothetical protein